MDERQFYLTYLKKKVKVTKEINNRPFFYNGVVTAVLENKLVLNDIKVGQVMFSFNEIKVIELTGVDDHGSR